MNHRVRKAIQISMATMLIFTTAAASAQEVTIKASSSCGEWIEKRAAKGLANLPNEMWLLGYLSGMSIGTGKDILQGADHRSLHAWMDNYCKANPLSRTNEGGADLFYELLKKNGLSR